jgi:hypothetical protein
VRRKGGERRELLNVSSTVFFGTYSELDGLKIISHILAVPVQTNSNTTERVAIRKIYGICIDKNLS